MELFKILKGKAKRKKKTIILPESYDKRVIKAAKTILKKEIAKIILIRNGGKINIHESKNLSILDVNFSEQFAEEYSEIKQKKNPAYTIENALEEVVDRVGGLLLTF